jgi:hypothetical protein
MIPGHTKFVCDSCFGLIKILYRKSKVNTIDDVVSIVNRSTTVHLNTSQRYLDGKDFSIIILKIISKLSKNYLIFKSIIIFTLPQKIPE